MNTLKALADEYLRNIEVMEQRMEELETKLHAVQNREVRYKLRRRIGVLLVMVNESRKIAFQMEHYYDKPGKGDAHVKSIPQHRKERTKYSGTGYGIASPAACSDGGDADTKTVSGIYAAFCRRSSAKGDCG